MPIAINDNKNIRHFVEFILNKKEKNKTINQ